MIKKELIILIFSLFSLSCASQKKEVIAKSKIKLEDENTNIRDLIEIDGYYPISSKLKYGAYMFFEDGSWVLFPFKSGISKKETEKSLIGSLRGWIDGGQIRWGTYWGVYQIQNDTIIVHSYDKATLLKGWSLDEERYKIINRESIKRIYVKGLLKSSDDYYKAHTPWKEEAPMSFTPADSLPSSDNWLKENKWIWRHESDWKNYMQKIEQAKIKKQ